ncbi:MAG: hypothetical protein H6912_08320 [Kordiimonadaceae bacterium]|nr:hypothetical protein [Kordiimonadaceae bacterium]
MKYLMTTIMFICGIFQSAHAAPGDAALGLKVGTLGAGVELTMEAVENVNLRFGANYFKLSRQINVEDNDYDMDLKLNSYTAFADWFITDSSFRITAGAFVNENGLTGTSLPSNTYDIGDNTYTSADVGILTAKVDFTSVAPYVGIGWGNPLADDSDWSFMVDLGVVFAGKPRLDINSTGGLLSNDPLLQADIAQAEQDFRDTDEIKYLRYYPVISVGLNYRF